MGNQEVRAGQAGRAAASPAIFGREAEVAAVRAFVESSGAPRALLLEGEAGIGKTTLWCEGVSRAAQVGRLVLQASPAEAEAGLAFAGLGDLLADVSNEARDELPEPQRWALAVALLEQEPGPRPLDVRAVGVALLGVVGVLARDHAVLIAVDDLQWLDAATAAALTFTLRRVRQQPLQLLAARRLGDVRPDPGLERSLPAERVRLGPLSVGALHRLVRARFAFSLPRPLLVRVHELCGGNPFFALEVARTLRHEHLTAWSRIPLPDDVHALVDQRLDQLPPATQTALLHAAAAGEPTVDLLRAAVGTPVDLEPARAAGLIDVRGNSVRFAHPLYAAAVVNRASVPLRRSTHWRLAELVVSREQRARHLAEAAIEPDADVAAMLEDGGSEARDRGAPAMAAALLERAAELTPAGAVRDRLRRVLTAAQAHIEAGDEARARTLLEGVEDGSGEGESRVDALLTLARTHADRARHRVLAERALAAAGGDPRLRAQVYLELAYAAVHQLDERNVVDFTEKAIALAGDDPDPRVRVRVLSRAGRFFWHAGDPRARAILERALAFEDAVRPLPAYDGPGTWLGWLWVDQDHVDRARPLLERQHARAVAAGDEHQRRWLAAPLTELETIAGRFRRALAYAEDAYDVAEAVDSAHSMCMFLDARARAHAHLGELETARALALDARARAEEIDSQLFRASVRRTLGFVALSDGAYREAIAALEPLAGDIRARSVADLVEAYVAVGALEAANAVLENLEQDTKRDRPALLRRALRCRGILLTAQGEPQDAVRALEKARAVGDTLNAPFEDARTLLALGIALRRAKRRAHARETLERAIAAFQSLEASAWVVRGRQELGRIGGRTASHGDLTASERRIAELVADGKTNKEVAASLFITVHTVEAALTRVYAKLGVRSRTELARHF
jgi:DNA-binding CsgD family transcriptional regulator/Tfp pilus assembly protein PilF